MNINFVNAIKSMLKAMPKNTYSIKETPKLTENGYTEEFENEILKIIAEHEKEKKNQTNCNRRRLYQNPKKTE